MQHLNECVKDLFDNGSLTNLIVRVGIGDNTVCTLAKTAQNRTLTEKTLFNMASVTKIMATTTLALIAIDRGILKLEDSPEKFYSAPRAKELTIKNLLTHTIGIGHKSLTRHTDGYESVGEYILNIPADVLAGSDVLYSCPGFILLGQILEKVFDERLDVLFKRLVAEPLGMDNTEFLPDSNQDIVNANLSADAHIVHDYNCRHLGGVCGNAGLFSNLDDVTLYTKMLLAKGAPLISKDTFNLAVQNHTQGMSQARGLGFLYVDNRYPQTGNLFPEGSIGHCGYTGQSIFADARSGLYAIILSDATLCTQKKYGRERPDEVHKMRRDIHNAIKLDMMA